MPFLPLSSPRTAILLCVVRSFNRLWAQSGDNALGGTRPTTVHGRHLTTRPCSRDSVEVANSFRSPRERTVWYRRQGKGQRGDVCGHSPRSSVAEPLRSMTYKGEGLEGTHTAALSDYTLVCRTKKNPLYRWVTEINWHTKGEGLEGTHTAALSDYTLVCENSHYLKGRPPLTKNLQQLVKKFQRTQETSKKKHGVFYWVPTGCHIIRDTGCITRKKDVYTYQSMVRLNRWRVNTH